MGIWWLNVICSILKMASEMSKNVYKDNTQWKKGSGKKWWSGNDDYKQEIFRGKKNTGGMGTGYRPNDGRCIGIGPRAGTVEHLLWWSSRGWYAEKVRTDETIWKWFGAGCCRWLTENKGGGDHKKDLLIDGRRVDYILAWKVEKTPSSAVNYLDT